MNLFCADMHLGNKNVLVRDNRPFASIMEHDMTIMANWNESVDVNDDVYIMGDLSWLSLQDTVSYLNRLKGRKHLIRGNNDQRISREPDFRACFAEIRDYKELKIEGKGIVLCHYPLIFYNNHAKGWYHFYGDVHNGYEDNVVNRVRGQIADLEHKPNRMLNVGMMQPYMNYMPRTFAELQCILKNNKGGKEEYDLQRREAV